MASDITMAPVLSKLVVAAYIFGIAASMAAPAEAAASMDLPGVGLSELSWGMQPSEIKKLYPSLGGAPVDPKLLVTFEAPALRTKSHVVAGCRYQVYFYLDPLDSAGRPAESPGLAAVSLSLHADQVADCRGKAITLFESLLGPADPPVNADPFQRTWRSQRTIVITGVERDPGGGERFQIGLHDPSNSPF